MSAPLMYLAFPVEYLLNPLINGADDKHVPVNGALVPVRDIYADIALLTALTMVPLAIFAIARLMRRPRPISVSQDGQGWVRLAAARLHKRPFRR